MRNTTVILILLSFLGCHHPQKEIKEVDSGKEELKVEYYQEKIKLIMNENLATIKNCEEVEMYIDSAFQIDTTLKLLKIKSQIDSVKKQIKLMNEYNIHNKSFDENNSPRHPIDRMDTVINANRSFVDYIIENMQDKQLRYYISDRNLLLRKKRSYCSKNFIGFKDTLRNGDSIVVDIRLAKFEKHEHVIEIDKNSSFNRRIDGQIPYGAYYSIPTSMISSITINIDGNNFSLPRNAFENFFELNTCDTDYFSKPIEIYESINGDYLYIYFYGGEAADTWFAKLIFDHTKYIGRIVAEYGDLSMNGSFRKDFMGF